MQLQRRKYLEQKKHNGKDLEQKREMTMVFKIKRNSQKKGPRGKDSNTQEE